MQRKGTFRELNCVGTRRGHGTGNDTRSTWSTPCDTVICSSYTDANTALALFAVNEGLAVLGGGDHVHAVPLFDDLAGIQLLVKACRVRQSDGMAFGESCNVTFRKVRRVWSGCDMHHEDDDLLFFRFYSPKVV